MPRIMKLHRYIDHDSLMTHIDFQVTRSELPCTALESDAQHINAVKQDDSDFRFGHVFKLTWKARNVRTTQCSILQTTNLHAELSFLALTYNPCWFPSKLCEKVVK
ncbi:hypothetical protein DPMN_005421 [Dreissena polymorpha]|uniref:Uncharacterized protein n=1 Tax=Dreissena polymorpha TaxID=45954 RepID=A0A9D4MQB9_DREPO|nr:hypothetical protein DPMN_005421 [Dreissena polymorpha]